MSESVNDDLTFTNHDDGLIISPVKASSNDTLNTLRLEMMNMFSQSFDNLMVKMATVIETKLDDRFDSTVGNWNSKVDSKLSPILQRLGNIDSKVDAMEAQKSAEALNISENFPMQVLDRNQPRRESVFFLDLKRIITRLIHLPQITWKSNILLQKLKFQSLIC